MHYFLMQGIFLWIERKEIFCYQEIYLYTVILISTINIYNIVKFIGILALDSESFHYWTALDSLDFRMIHRNRNPEHMTRD